MAIVHIAHIQLTTKKMNIEQAHSKASFISVEFCNMSNLIIRELISIKIDK